MSWDDFDRRRAAIKSVLAYAAQYPAAGLPFEDLPEVRATFADRRELVLALQYDWTQALWARIELLSVASDRGGLTDAQDLARVAWTDCAVAYPVLRRLLDCYLDELGPAPFRERELLRLA